MTDEVKTQTQAENRFTKTLQTSSQALLLGAGVVYAFGFVILSLFESRYGIADFGVFRAKVIAAGTVFLFMLAIPTLAVFRLFHVHGLKQSSALIVFTPKADLTPERRTMHFFDVNLYIPFACAGFLFFLTPLLGISYKFSTRGNYLITVVYIISIGNGLLSKYRFHKIGGWVLVISLLNTSALFLVYYFCSTGPIFWLLLWMSMVSFFAVHTARALQEAKDVHKIEWERSFLVFVPFVFWIWASEIYPHVRHELGGGSPIQAVFQLSKETPGLKSGATMSLIDETDQGFYVLSPMSKAFFIPRSAVESVQFIPGSPSPSSDSHMENLPFNCERATP